MTGTEGNESNGVNMIIRPEVVAFAEGMEEILMLNDHKGGWKECSAAYLLDKLKEEFEELNREVPMMRSADAPLWWAFQDCPPNIRKRIAHEAVDLANICMMIYDRCRTSEPVTTGDS